jgi:hypothetical protein
MATSVMASMALKQSPFPFFGQSRLQGMQPSARSSSFRVMSKKAKKVQTTQPFGQYMLQNLPFFILSFLMKKELLLVYWTKLSAFQYDGTSNSKL